MRKCATALWALCNKPPKNTDAPAEFRTLAKEWLDNREDAKKSRELGDLIIAATKSRLKKGCDFAESVIALDHCFTKRSQWIIGGDGASYDIGYGGLDHVIASGKNVNILVLDTEVYSNTGGQASKSTPIGAIAKFAAAKASWIRKKDLGLMATTYGYVYVAQIAMGADNAQTLKAIREAEAYDGPSLIIAYSPLHKPRTQSRYGTQPGRREACRRMRLLATPALQPRTRDQGQNPFSLDSKEPDWSKFSDFLKEGEVRFASIFKAFPRCGSGAIRRAARG